MRYRDQIQRRIVKGMILVYGATAVAFLSALVGSVAKHPAWFVVTVVAGITPVLGLMFTLYSIRCPRCAKSIGMTLPNRGMAPLHRDYRNCPYCGFDLNQEMEESSNKPVPGDA